MRKINEILTVFVRLAINVVRLHAIADRSVSQNRNCIVGELQCILDRVKLIRRCRSQLFDFSESIVGDVEDFVAQNFAILTFFRHR